MKDSQYENTVYKNDNERLISRIKDLEQDCIRLKTDIATHDRLKQNSIEQITTDWKEKIDRVKEEAQRNLREKDIRIGQLEEEVKGANERLYRNSKFKHSVFSFEEPGYGFDGRQNETSFSHNLVGDSYDVRQFEDAKIASQEIPNFSKFKPEPTFIPGGSRDKPIELQPVRISPANSNRSYEIGQSSPVFSKASQEPSNSVKNVPEAQGIAMNPSNNPYYRGIYHGTNFMIPNAPNAPLPTHSISQSFDAIPRNFEFDISQNEKQWYPPSAAQTFPFPPK